MNGTRQWESALDRVLELTVLFNADMQSRFEREGLTAARVHLLWILQQQGPSTQRVLAEALGVTARNVTGLVDALDETGFVTRQPHPTDRRATLVTFTDRGAATMSAMAHEHQELAKALFGGMSPRQFSAFDKGLGMVLDELRGRIEIENPGSPA